MHHWLKRIGLLLASLLGAAPAAAAPPPEAPATTMTGLLREVSRDEALRTRFAADPAGVMQARGIDPAPYQLPDRLDAARLDRVLRDLADPLAARNAVPPQPQRLAQGSMPPVYGPPPTPERPPPRPVAPPDDDHARRAGPSPDVQVAVYGPPPRFRRTPDRK